MVSIDSRLLANAVRTHDPDKLGLSIDSSVLWPAVLKPTN